MIQIKKDLRLRGCLDGMHEIYDNLSGDKGQLTREDFLVQVWINYKIEDGCKLKDLLRLIPKEQSWLKRNYIKGLIGKPTIDPSPILKALKECEPVSFDEMNYIQAHSPVRGFGSLVSI